MSPDIQQVVQQISKLQSLDIPEVSRFSPADFRFAIQSLVAEDNLVLALAMVDAGISLYPQSEDILAIGGLLAMTICEWELAIELLQDLCAVQQDLVQPMTYQMLARALCCNLDMAEASQVLAKGLAAWPNDPTLLAEQATIGFSHHHMPAAGLRN